MCDLKFVVISVFCCSISVAGLLGERCSDCVSSRQRNLQSHRGEPGALARILEVRGGPEEPFAERPDAGHQHTILQSHPEALSSQVPLTKLTC